jgi:hypothetical protein
VPNPYYMALYSCVYNYCTSSTQPRSAGKTAHLAGEELYLHLETYFAAHVAAMPPVSQPRLPCSQAARPEPVHVFILAVRRGLDRGRHASSSLRRRVRRLQQWGEVHRSALRLPQPTLGETRARRGCRGVHRLLGPSLLLLTFLHSNILTFLHKKKQNTELTEDLPFSCTTASAQNLAGRLPHHRSDP